MQNQVIPNGSKVDTEYGVFEVLDHDLATEKYFCYKKILLVIAVKHILVTSTKTQNTKIIVGGF